MVSTSDASEISYNLQVPSRPKRASAVLPLDVARTLAQASGVGTTTYLGFLPSSVRLLCHPRNCFPPPSLPRETRPPLSLLLIPRDHDLNTGTAGHHHHHREHSRELLIAAPSIALTRGLSRLTRARFPPTLAFGPHDPRDHFSARTTRRSNLPVLPPTPSTYRVTRHFPRRPKKRPPAAASNSRHPPRPIRVPTSYSDCGFRV